MQIHVDRLKSRPLSWSSLSSFTYPKQGAKEEWAKKYLDVIDPLPSKEMLFGSMIGKKIEKDPNFLPEVPRLSKMEHEFRVTFNGILLVGYADTFDHILKTALNEYKTGKRAWDQKRANEHRQIDMYLLMNFITSRIAPEAVKCQLVWLPTQENGDFTITLVEPFKPQIFETKRNMQDILRFGMWLKKTYGEMIEYAESYPLA